MSTPAPEKEERVVGTTVSTKPEETATSLNTLIKESLDGRNSESGSSAGGGNNSDNSALVSLGINSFGFNFDSEDGSNDEKKEKQGSHDETKSNTSSVTDKSNAKPDTAPAQIISSASAQEETAANESAADTAVAHLDSLAANNNHFSAMRKSNVMATVEKKQDQRQAQPPPRKKKRGPDDQKREERNQREKERSYRISQQITELRNLLSSGGVIVPKGTKSSVLTEAATYIRMLQQHQYRSEIDRHQLVQQMQLIGQGSHGPEAAQAIRHFAARHGVWSLGNFGGVPPKTAMSPFYQAPNTTSSAEAANPAPTSASSDSNVFSQITMDPSEYRFIFNSCGVGMAIASMGGAFIDCNQLFCQLSKYSKQEVCSFTIFNLTARQDLQQAFDQISQLISPPMDAAENKTNPIVLRGAMKHRDDLGMSIALVKGDDDIAKCFCVTLVKNPKSPFDLSKPMPVSFDSIQTVGKEEVGDAVTSAPAFTAG